jgi:hypothetical protein
MQRRDPTGLKAQEAFVQKLAEDLCTKRSPNAILRCLKTLSAGLNEQARADHVVAVFMRAGGLPTLIRHLGASASSYPTADPDIVAWVPVEAAQALAALLRCQDVIKAELRAATGVIAPLIGVLRGGHDGSRRLSCSVACNALLVLADFQPAHCKGMAEAGVMGLLLALYSGIGDSASPGFAKESAMLAARLARLLMEAGTVGAHDLERAIRAPDPVQCFGALLLLQVRQFCLCPSARLVNIQLPDCVSLSRAVCLAHWKGYGLGLAGPIRGFSTSGSDSQALACCNHC